MVGRRPTRIVKAATTPTTRTGSLHSAGLSQQQEVNPDAIHYLSRGNIGRRPLRIVDELHVKKTVGIRRCKRFAGFSI
jgi:hypothetical protein